jgi:predicted RNase H-like nuclease
MEFIGVDLAWTQSGRTGLCHVRNGRVEESFTTRVDSDLLGWLQDRCQENALLAIDAPLIVRNTTGRRRCEQLISQCFGAQHASTHPANLTLPAFRNGVRGEWLARALGVDIDPLFDPGVPVRRAVEVYPHTAIVALFDLATTLKYKSKPGRDLASRSRELNEARSATPRTSTRLAFAGRIGATVGDARQQGHATKQCC